jgi:hypothetical protein
MNKSELATTFREQIRAFHRKSLELDEQIRAQVLEKCNTTRACGITLQEAKDSLHREDFHAMVHELGLSSSTVRSYISFAHKHEEKFGNFTVAVRSAFEFALTTTGLLPMADGYSSAQESHDPPGFFTWASHVTMQFTIRWKKYLAARPLDSWDVSQAEQFIYGLRPILKVHKIVSDWLARQHPS